MRRCLLICEGPFDELIFSILKELFDESLLEVKPLCRCCVDSPNLICHVDDLINEILAKEHGYVRSDFDEICFLIDSDGIYVSDSYIHEDNSLSHTNYNLESIKCPDKKSLINRNKKRINNIKDVLEDGKYWIFYNSRNLEHSFDETLYQHLSDKFKKRFALTIFNIFEENKDSFIYKLFEMNKSGSMNYLESWEYLFNDFNSLSSCSNMFIFILLHCDALREEYKSIVDKLVQI